jgi:hypothetical protein
MGAWLNTQKVWLGNLNHGKLGRPWRRWKDKIKIEICALLGYYAASSGNPLLTFQENVSVPSSRAKMGSIRCREMSVKNYHSTLRNNLEERTSHQHGGGSPKLRKIKIILKRIGCEVDWIYLAEDRVKWQPLVNTVPNLRMVRIKRAEFLGWPKTC